MDKIVYIVKNERKIAEKLFLDFLMIVNNKYTLNIDDLRLLKDIILVNLDFVLNGDICP